MQNGHAMTTAQIPDSARVVIIGGGVMGCSVAYHLTKHGWRDVVLLEQGRLSCGTTWHAAGLVGQLRAHQNMTRLVQYSADLYARLEAETGLATGWKQCGSVLVARTPERLSVFKRIAAAATAQADDKSANAKGAQRGAIVVRGGSCDVALSSPRRTPRWPEAPSQVQSRPTSPPRRCRAGEPGPVRRRRR